MLAAAIVVAHTGAFASEARLPVAQSNGGVLAGVAATSPTNAWAVGHIVDGGGGFDRTLIERWNGTAWKLQTSPSVGSSTNQLTAVAATSSTNAWAVGTSLNGTTHHTRNLIEHWNGTTWKVQTSPSVGSSGDSLTAVAATSSTNAWAAGVSFTGTTNRTLIEHWNGTAWKVQQSPNVAGSANSLEGVVAISPTDVWAVGASSSAMFEGHALIEHWNGATWKIVNSPPTGAARDGFNAVAATSSKGIWAVGARGPAQPVSGNTLIEHWNGTAWKIESSPNPGTSRTLEGAVATSPANAWVVGTYSQKTFVAHWNGIAWKLQSSPSPSAAGGGFDSLSAVTATSASNAWAVGSREAPAQLNQPLVERWNGTAWKVQVTAGLG